MSEDLLKPDLTFCGPIAVHNMPCSICLQEHAVYDCNKGYFLPCWACQKAGWVTKHEKPKFISKFWRALLWKP